MKNVYLDYSATTPVDKRVVETMLPYFSEIYGNASSIHGPGRDAKDAIEHARENVARVINADPEEIYFTSGGTEADNWAIKGYALSHKDKGNHIITSKIEHSAVLNSCRNLQSQGFEVTYLGIQEDGTLDLDELKDSIKDTTVLISIMHVNNEIGVINDIETIGKIAKERDIGFHTDAVQSYGKVPIDVKNLHVDLVSMSSHKIYGPKGVGALFKKGDVFIDKFMHGGGSHENGMRSGTENVSAIIGFGEAAKICGNEIEEEAQKLTKLRNYFWEQIKANIPDSKLNGTLENRLPGNLNVSFKDADGESVLLSLDLRGVAASSGSACAAGGIEPSHVILALSLPPEYNQSSIRFSFGRYTTKEEVDYTVDALKEVIARIRDV